MACAQVQKTSPPPHSCPQELPVWTENTNDLPSHYFKTDLVRNLAPGHTARSFETNTFRDCLNIRNGRVFKILSANPSFYRWKCQGQRRGAVCRGSQHTLEAEGAAARWLVPTPFLTESAFRPPGEDSPPLLPPLYSP